MKRLLKTLYSFFVFALIIFVLFFISVIIMAFYAKAPITNDYAQARKIIVYKDKITHFPKVLPKNAKNIKVVGFSNIKNDGELIMLSFEVDEKYIDKEFTKYKFWNYEDKIGMHQKLNVVPDIASDMQMRDYTYFALDTQHNREDGILEFPCFNGIAIRHDKKAIMYYYITSTLGIAEDIKLKNND